MKALISAKFRYRQQDVYVKLTICQKNKIKVICDKPQLAITPGQFAVFYQENICLGGGIISKVFN
jgi:tRNA-specific 2-thiouridylase